MTTFVRKSWPFVAFAAILAVFFFPVLFRGSVIAPLDLLGGLLRPWADGPCGAGVHNQCTVDAIRQHIPYDWAVFDSLRRDGFVGYFSDHQLSEYGYSYVRVWELALDYKKKGK